MMNTWKTNIILEMVKADMVGENYHPMKDISELIGADSKQIISSMRGMTSNGYLKKKEIILKQNGRNFHRFAYAVDLDNPLVKRTLTMARKFDDSRKNL